MNPPSSVASLTLSNCRWLRFLTLCVLYFAQGVPYGFVTIALVSILSEQGATAAQTGSLVALAVLPWTFKFAWGPLIDSFRMPTFGQRRPWIVLAQMGMAATLLMSVSGGSLTSDASLAALGTIVFVHNCFASLQDVATDALAIDVLPDGERGSANGAMWGSKLTGASVGGAGSAILAANYGMVVAMQAMALLMLAIMLVPLLTLERAGDRRFPWSSKTDPRKDEPRAARVAPWKAPLRVALDLYRSLTLRATFMGLVVALLANVGHGLIIPVNAEVFTQRIGWSAEHYSFVQGSYGLGGKLLGAIVGGILCDRLGARRLFVIGVAVASLSLLGFGLTSSLWTHAGYPLEVFTVALEAGFALSGVSALTLFMRLSWTNAAATQFTLYMTAVNVGYAMGPMFTRLGFEHRDAYLLGAALVVAPIAALPFVDLETVARRRRRDTAPARKQVRPATTLGHAGA